MTVHSISLKEARRLILASQNLNGAKKTTLDHIEHLGHIQIDTISVVERAHHHVLWTRNNSYKKKDLSDLAESRDVFEYWSHAASFLPMSEYRFTLPMKKEFATRSSSWFPKDPKVMKQVLKRIKEEGPLKSKDFERAKKGSSGWWDWKPAKKALERLFFEGKLEITKREGFQKVYDIPERVIPSSVDTSMPTNDEFARFLIKRIVRHHGLANVKEMAYLHKKPVKDLVEKALKSMIEEGELIELRVEALAGSYYCFPKALDSIPRSSSKVLLLSPFDNFTIQRNKLKTFFDYDYQIECYVPEKKRKFGYFTLPIFSGVIPVGRVDLKAHRKEKSLVINSLHYEKGIDQDEFSPEIRLNSVLKSFAKFNGCKLEL